MSAPKTRSGTATTPNAKRKRPMVTITLSPAGLARLDKLRLGDFANMPGTRPLARGEYIDMLGRLDEARNAVNLAPTLALEKRGKKVRSRP